MILGTFSLVLNFMMQKCNTELKTNYYHRANSIISLQVYTGIYTRHTCIPRTVSNSQALSSIGANCLLNTHGSLYWNWKSDNCHILPVTKICGAPVLCLPDLSFFADITTVLKNYHVPEFHPSTTYTSEMYIQTFTLASCINYHFHKIPISCCKQSCHCFF